MGWREGSLERREGKRKSTRRHLGAQEHLPRLLGAALLHSGHRLGGVAGAAEAGGLRLGLVQVREGLVCLGSGQSEKCRAVREKRGGVVGLEFNGPEGKSEGSSAEGTHDAPLRPELRPRVLHGGDGALERAQLRPGVL